MATARKDAAAEAIRECLISANMDQNSEPANVVDGLFAVARGLCAISDSLDAIAAAIRGARDEKGKVKDG